MAAILDLNLKKSPIKYPLSGGVKEALGKRPLQ
jgi:hypothetical protein